MNLPIIDYLIKLDESKVTSFHVPGHKNGKIYPMYKYGEFFSKLGHIDTTEIIGTDNLHNPTGIIKDSQEIAKEVFGSKETFFLINGSTSGVYSMIMATTSPGDKIIVNRNCHQSVIHGCILAELRPVYVYPEIDYARGIPLGVSPEEVEKLIRQNMDAKAVLITYPTYEGVASDLKKIADIVHKYDKILLVDEAHGSHLGLSEILPKTALQCGADIVVQSTHKTLPALTQSSMLHVQGNRIDMDKLKFMLRVHQSSSPSYILMGSLEFAVMLYKQYGQALMGDLLSSIEQFKRELGHIKSIELLTYNSKIHSNNYTIDPTKLYISSRNRFSGVWLETYLREKFNIQMELSNLNGVLGVTTIANDQDDFDNLLRALYSLDNLDVDSSNKLDRVSIYPPVEQRCTPREGLYRQKKSVELKNSVGLVSGEFVIPYPPGIPLVVPGEVISKEIIQYILMAISQGISIVGLKDKTLKFIEVII